MTVDFLLAGLVGLALGSFLNVVITRLPQGESVWAGRSRCPQCRSPVWWYDNIPLCSYVWLRGRCRSCGAAIPWRYPLVELAGGLMGLALWHTFPDKLLLLAYAPFGLALLALSAIDLEHRLLPDAITIPGTILGLLLSLVLPQLSFPEAAAGALVGAALFFGVGRLYEKWAGRRGLGGGDVKMLAMIGAFLGVWALPLVILISASLGTLTGLIRVLGQGAGARDQWRTISLPYGPFLAAGAWCYLFWGERLLSLLSGGG
ncbi:MAG: prepilin peptidase [Deltaproteobacteria bacterium]|nr:prepilin peptidase [Deltaproteobacteria bacterium]